MKLQKFLSNAGFCSRRKAEEYIAAGLVSVNGEKAHIGQIIDPENDSVEVDNQVIHEQDSLVYYVYNKPRGIVTTCATDKNWEEAILDITEFPERVFPIGRLDKDTTGLIIMTNDWRLSNFLIHPRYEHEKEYIVEVYGKIEDEALDAMRKWVRIELKDPNQKKSPMRYWNHDKIREKTILYKTKPCLIERLSWWKFSIILEEWKNRQIRRMVQSVRHDVKKLKRIRIENIKLWELAEGEYRSFTQAEKRTLFERIGIEPQSASI